ncbi:MAG: peptidylprolyl isomerase [Candidatus Thorarchaeota archaeon]|jgi:FKBP-type peptidyl-prolyl cis-trans isomerase 2
MAEKLKKNDFIEIQYTGKVKDGDVFDTNIADEAKKINLEIKDRPLIICLGQGMILPAIDEFLIGKNADAEYTLELPSEKAFGKRKRELIKTMPISVFNQAKAKPQAGMIFAFDNMLGKITTVSGGRVIVDFNNPLAGKDVTYNLKVKRILKDEKEKIKSLMRTFFRKEFTFRVEQKKLILRVDEKLKKFVEMFKSKFKEILDLELSVENI